LPVKNNASNFTPVRDFLIEFDSKSLKFITLN
jgi:hypothetical protein